MADKLILSPLSTLKNFSDLSVGRLLSEKQVEVFEVTPITSAMIVRREDFLFLSFLFSGLGLKSQKSKAPTLVRTGKLAHIAVVFPQQSIAEEAFVPKEPTSVAFPARARLSGLSWLTFKVPDKIKSIPYTLKALLDWREWQLLNTPVDGIPKDGSLASAIEAPFRLLLAPPTDALWHHPTDPVQHGDHVELWHTQLKELPPNLLARGKPVVPRVAKVRAAWARDFRAFKDEIGETFTNPFTTSISPDHRTQLVLLSSTTTKNFTPEPITAHKLMLTSLGAYLDLRGAWDDNYRGKLNPVLTSRGATGVDLSEWRHIGTLGRDHYVRVVQEGVLLPFGHRAAKVTITERRFHTNVRTPLPADEGAATLFQEMFIVVREPVKEMRASGPVKVVEGGDLIDSLLPFNRVRISNLSAVRIDPPGKSKEAPDPKSQIGNVGEDAFWIRAGGEDFRFNLIGEDWEDHPCEFRLPLIFVSDKIEPSKLQQVVNTYNEHINSINMELIGRRQAETFGRLVAFAPPTKKGGDTSFESQSLTFRARSTKSTDTERFRPALLKAMVRIGAVEQMVGTAAPAEIEYPSAYLTAGIQGTSNAGEVFAQLVSKSPALNFSGQAQKSGGVVTPNLTVNGLSRRFGVVGGTPGQATSTAVNNLAKGKFDPFQYFDLNSAKLLGGISLADIIAPVFGDAEVPTLQRTPIFDGGETPVAMETTLAWNPQLKDHAILKFRQPDKKGDPKGLSLTVKLRSSLSGEEPTASINCVMGSFSLVFLNVIEIRFTSLIFNQQPGQKLDVGAKLPQSCVRFAGPFAFLNPIAELVDSVGFDDPPSLEVDASGARVGYSLGLPPLTIGAYAVQNITLGAALNIPFAGDAIRVRFNFCERHSPFLLTISGVAGGGFCAIGLGADGIESIEAALEFGGNIALHLGVASGGVCIMGGFYFASDENAMTFTAYVRAAGVLEVLSLIAISTEFYLGLSYSKLAGSGRFWGQASLTVEVEVAFFSKSVSMTVEREFAGGDNDPAFQQLTSLEHYQQYRAAFA